MGFSGCLHWWAEILRLIKLSLEFIRGISPLLLQFMATPPSVIAHFLFFIDDLVSKLSGRMCSDAWEIHIIATHSCPSNVRPLFSHITCPFWSFIKPLHIGQVEAVPSALTNFTLLFISHRTIVLQFCLISLLCFLFLRTFLAYLIFWIRAYWISLRFACSVYERSLRLYFSLFCYVLKLRVWADVS